MYKKMYAKTNKYNCMHGYWESRIVQHPTYCTSITECHFFFESVLPYSYIAKSRFAGSFLELYNRKSRQAEKTPFVGFVVYFTTTRSILNGVIAFTACGMPAGMMMD